MQTTRSAPAEAGSFPAASPRPGAPPRGSAATRGSPQRYCRRRASRLPVPCAVTSRA